jgi:hypothetical protein
LDRKPVASPGELPQVLVSALANKVIQSTGRVTVLLQPPLVQTRTLDGLPPVPRSELTNLVTTQARRFFRVNGGRLVAAAAWVPNADGVQQARAAAADHALVAAIESAARDARVSLTGIFPGTGNAVDGTLALETAEGRRMRTRDALRRVIAPVGIALMCWVSAATTYVLDLSLDGRSVATELADLATPLARIRDIEDRLNDFTPVAAAVKGQGPGGAWATDLLARVAEALPDSSQVVRFTAHRRGEVRLEIRAPEPALVLKAFADDSFQAPALVSPPIPADSVPGRTWKRFTLTARRHP